ncbi:MAG: hypothetical protein ACJ8BF_00870 [Gemmatimonadales bacterium]
MTGKRGREARLKREHAGLYPGLKPGLWMPVEDLLRHITNLIHQDRAKARVITGTRLLRQEHFEFRGASARPEGLPSGSTRLSDSGAEPRGQDGTGRGISDYQPAKNRGSEP